MMTEAEGRRALVSEARSWIGTPYVSNGLVKGPKGGTDCAMFILAVYQGVGLLPKEFDPRPYPAQWHIHQNAERYLGQVERWAHEVAAPPQHKPEPGDVVMFLLGRVFAHGAIVVDWPNVIHAVGGDRVLPEDISTNTTGKRALWTVPKRYFSYWKPSVR